MYTMTSSGVEYLIDRFAAMAARSRVELTALGHTSSWTTRILSTCAVRMSIDRTVSSGFDPSLVRTIRPYSDMILNTSAGFQRFDPSGRIFGNESTTSPPTTSIKPTSEPNLFWNLKWTVSSCFPIYLDLCFVVRENVQSPCPCRSTTFPVVRPDPLWTFCCFVNHLEPRKRTIRLRTRKMIQTCD